MRKKIIGNIAKALAVAMSMSFVVAPLAACGGNEGARPTNEDTPLVLASDILDGVFNPFFYTSGSDGEVVSQTQIGMLSGDKKGKPVSGWDEACVAFDHSVVTTGNKELINNSVKGDAAYESFYTDYYFAIKDNILFSDGVKLTKDDVLFNIYMYLDPAYTGSSTMYSVNIKGLKAYRAQSEDPEDQKFSEGYYDTLATTRINALRDWIEENDDSLTWDDLADFIDFDNYDTGDTPEKDLEKIHELFKEEITAYLNSAKASDPLKDFEKYKDKNGKPLITERWEAFLYQFGRLKLNPCAWDDNGRVTAYEKEDLYTKPNQQNDYSDEALINYVYDAFFGDYMTSTSTKKYREKVYDVITYYGTASTFFSYVRSQVISKELKGEMKVKSVSGIKIEPMTQIPYGRDAAGNLQYRKLTDAYGGEYTDGCDVLHITINGVDPKAIQNFSFTVAPGHHYGKDWNRAKTDPDYFGVSFSDSAFMTSVRVKQVPLGAGAYMAADEYGNPTDDKSEFFSDNVVYLVRNENFLLGVPKIKKLRFKVVPNNSLYGAVKNGDVHYASPSMDIDTVKKLEGGDASYLEYGLADNLGYGYIGVSAQYIPNIWVRRAIMTALDPTYCVSYYGGNQYAQVITMPMSRTMVDYYEEVTRDYPDTCMYHVVKNADGTTNNDATGERIRDYLRQGGCTPGSDGVYVDNKYTKQRLKYTFTIAGDSDDHPANSMLIAARNLLNDNGFEITLTHDSTALSKLASGLLTVWAAAWSSSSDPDMYQVYHKDSTATSTLAWGYNKIKSMDNNDDGQKNLLNQLADKIEEGREYTEVNDRAPVYREAMELLMQLAVEFPTYQRKVYYVWQKDLFDNDTIYTKANLTTYQSPLSKIWNVSFNEG